MKLRAVIALCFLFLAAVLHPMARAEDISDINEVTYDTNVADNSYLPSEDNVTLIEKLLSEESDIQFYAYQDLENVEPSLKPVVLAARNIIVHRYSWVADGIYGCILDTNGDMEEELPQFHELFPDDWDEPVYPVEEVDLSYYGL